MTSQVFSRLKCKLGYHNVEIFLGKEKGTWLYACDKCGNFSPQPFNECTRCNHINSCHEGDF